MAKMQFLCIALFVIAIQQSCFADNVKVYKKNGLSVKVVDKNSGLPSKEIQNMVTTFFSVYPKMMREYNPKSAKDVTLEFDPNYAGLSAPAGNIIHFSVSYHKNVPNDLNVVVFKAMSLVQYRKF